MANPSSCTSTSSRSSPSCTTRIPALPSDSSWPLPPILEPSTSPTAAEHEPSLATPRILLPGESSRTLGIAAWLLKNSLRPESSFWSQCQDRLSPAPPLPVFQSKRLQFEFIQHPLD